VFLLDAVGDGIEDDTWRRMTNPEMASRCPIASSRIETRRAEVSFGW
jgi:hypothetical protein